MDKGNLEHFCHIRLPQMPFIPQGTQSFSNIFSVSMEFSLTYII